MNFFKSFLLLSLIVFYAAPLQAELRVEVKKNTGNAVPIAIVPFGRQSTDTKVPVDIAAIVNADLSSSDFFKILPEQQMLTKPSSATEVRFRAWQILGQDYVVVGKIAKLENNYSIFFQLLGVSKKELLMDYKISSAEQGLRGAAHKISDLIYEKISGKKAVFSNKIVFVSHEVTADNDVYKLQISGLDGFEAKTVVSSSEPIMSPAVSPEGEKIAYVSFETHRPVIFVQTLATAERTQVAAFSGINGAPAWSPDGKKLAITLSKDGNPNIYILDLGSGVLTQLTKMSGINTEAAWSPDGQTIVFTSDESGKPQLYKIPPSGGEPERLTSEGDNNSNASFSPDGQKIAMVHGSEGSYKIAVLELSTGTINNLTSGSLDESPCYSSNGAMIVYATQKASKIGLAAISADGKNQQKLDFQSNQVYNPIWIR